MEPDLTQMTDDELIDLQRSLSVQREELVTKGAEVQAELDRRALERQFEGMPDEERQRLAQFLTPESVPSQEQVNG